MKQLNITKAIATTIMIVNNTMITSPTPTLRIGTPVVLWTGAKLYKNRGPVYTIGGYAHDGSDVDRVLDKVSTKLDYTMNCDMARVQELVNDGYTLRALENEGNGVMCECDTGAYIEADFISVDVVRKTATLMFI